MKWTMPLEDVLRLKSNDAYYRYQQYTLDGQTVADEIICKDIDDEYHQRIMKVMEREHVNLVPVLIIDDVLYNGHRRVKIACELNLDEILVTDNWYDSGWYDESTVIGEKEAA